MKFRRQASVFPELDSLDSVSPESNSQPRAMADISRPKSGSPRWNARLFE